MNLQRFYLLFANIVFASLAIRFSLIVDASLSIDEMISLNAVQNLSLENLFFDNHPPLYLIILKISCMIFDYSEFAVRCPSVLLSSATTGLVGWILMRQNISKNWVLVGMALHACFPLSIEYAREARPYALLEFASCFQFLVYLQYIKNQASAKRLIAASFIAFISSYLSVLLFIFEWAFSLKKNKSILSVIGINLVLIVIIVASRELVDWRYLSWQIIKYRVEELAFFPIDVFKAFAFNSLASGLSIFILSTLMLVKSDSDKLKDFFRTMAIVFSFLLVFICFSMVSRRAIFIPRYFIFLSPIYFYFLTKAFYETSQLTKKIKYTFVFGTILIFIGAAKESIQVIQRKKSDWRGVASSVGTYPNSVVITTSNLAIKTPYFDNQGILVSAIENPEQVLQQVVQLLNSYENVWIIDSYWNYILYLPSQLPYFKTMNLQVDDFTEFEAGRDALATFKVSKKIKK